MYLFVSTQSIDPIKRLAARTHTAITACSLSEINKLTVKNKLYIVQNKAYKYAPVLCNYYWLVGLTYKPTASKHAHLVQNTKDTMDNNITMNIVI